MTNMLTSGNAMVYFQDGNILYVTESECDREDVKEGYVDCVGWSSYRINTDLSEPELEQVDGGIIMLEIPLSEISDGELIFALRCQAGIRDTKNYLIVNV